VHLAKSLCPLLCLPILAAAGPGPLGLSFVDTSELRLLYSDPSLTYLVPHTARNMDIDVVLSNSFGFGGTNGSLVFRRFAG